MSTDSSSSEEDLSLFQSVAVSADDIAESARKEAQKAEARRRSSSSSSIRNAPAADNAVAGADAATASDDKIPTSKHDVHGQDDNCELDITSRRIAAALDVILARQLDPATAAVATAEATAASATVQQQQLPAIVAVAEHASAATTDTFADDTGVRLFKRVAPGAPCAISSSTTEYGSNAIALGVQQPAGAADASTCHLHPIYLHSKSRPFRSVKEIIPRLNLAQSSTNSNNSSGKKRHAQVLQEVTVDGAALIAEASGADTAWRQLQQLQQKHEEQLQLQLQDGKKPKKKKKKSGLATHAALEAWKSMRKNKADGVVLEAKEFVPYGVRMAKLVGSTTARGAAAAATAASS